jgi:hypothetical protein
MAAMVKHRRTCVGAAGSARQTRGTNDFLSSMRSSGQLLGGGEATARRIEGGCGTRVSATARWSSRQRLGFHGVGSGVAAVPYKGLGGSWRAG